MCFVETWRTSPVKLKSKDWGEYNAFWSNAIKEKSRGRASGGLLVLVRKPIKSSLADMSDSWIIIIVESSSP